MKSDDKLSLAKTEPVEMSAFKRFMWQLVDATFLKVLPTSFHKTRNRILRFFGAKLAGSATISRSAKIDYPWNFEMGEFSKLGAHSCVNCQHKVLVGDKCCIGENVNLLTGSHIKPEAGEIQPIKPIEIQRGCWISTNSCILQGVVLGEYTMVGEKSVVESNTEPFSIVAGVPAKVIEKAIITG